MEGKFSRHFAVSQYSGRIIVLQGYTATEYLDSEAPGKSKVSVQQRKQRRHAFGMGKTIGRDIRGKTVKL